MQDFTYLKLIGFRAHVTDKKVSINYAYIVSVGKIPSSVEEIFLRNVTVNDTSWTELMNQINSCSNLKVLSVRFLLLILLQLKVDLKN